MKDQLLQNIFEEKNATIHTSKDTIYSSTKNSKTWFTYLSKFIFVNLITFDTFKLKVIEELEMC